MWQPCSNYLVLVFDKIASTFGILRKSRSRATFACDHARVFVCKAILKQAKLIGIMTSAVGFGSDATGVPDKDGIILLPSCKAVTLCFGAATSKDR